MNGENVRNGIAVIGMACRFPGAVDKDIFWENLKTGVESITCFSDQELEESGIAREIYNQPAYVRKGFIIEDEDKFDAAFFGYSPREAEGMDPQQRLFLETAWKALEDGGYPPGEYHGSVGMFAGSKISTYLLNLLNEGKSLYGTAAGYQKLIGNDKDYLVTRASYKLNLKGPSVAVQCACSTSLVAVHFACESVLSGACNMALAGGVSVSVPQKAGYLYQEGMVLSPDGHCRAFDEQARGMMPGNGVGVVLLKDLEKALKDNDHIYAVVRGTAVNNDGADKTGYTTPSVAGQAKVIREAITIAEIDCESISYVETHGTGTELGDPIEIESISDVFRAETDKKGFCAIGSVKTNIGHLDTAAGIASFIKTVLSLQHAQIPPSLNFSSPNPKIDFDETPFFVNTQLSEWQTNGTPMRAGVSSFGFGGTNAHVILEQAPDRAFEIQASKHPLYLLTLSAKTPAALMQQIQNYDSFLNNREFSINDVCFTANTGRSHFKYRFAAIAASLDELRRLLSASKQGETASNLFTGVADNHIQPKISFDLSGQSNDFDLLTDICSDSHVLKSSYRLPLSRLNKEEYRLIFSALGNLYVRGADIDWGTYYNDAKKNCRIPLPTYPFEKKRHWREKTLRSSDAISFSKARDSSTMPFNGRQMACATPVFQFEVSLSAYPFLKKHQIHGKVVIPVGAFWEMVLAVAKTYLGTEHFFIKNMTLHEAMVISENQPVLTLQIVLDTGGLGDVGFNIFCKEELSGQPKDDWKKYVSGKIAVESVYRDPMSFETIRNVCEHAYDVSRFIQDLYALDNITGNAWESPWQFQEIWANDSNALAKITFSNPFLSEAGTCQLHPSIFEPCLQTMFAIPLSQADDTIKDKVYLPIGFDRINYTSAILKEIWCHVAIHPGKNWHDPDFTADFQLFGQQGEILSQMLGAHMRQAPASMFLRADGILPCYKVQWQKCASIKHSQRTAQASSTDCWLVLGDRGGIAEKLVQQIQSDGGAWAMLYNDGSLRIHSNQIEHNDTLLPRESFEHIFMEKLPGHGLRCIGIIHCWGLDSPDREEQTCEELESRFFFAYSSTAKLVRALVSSGLTIDRFCLLTQDAQAVTGKELVDVGQASLRAMQKCLEKEHPELNVHLFDLDKAGGSRQIKSLWEMLRAGTIEREIAFRHDCLYVPRLVSLGSSRDRLSSPDKNLGIYPDATYLITGGFGGAGLETAGWMVEHGARHLVLLGRSDPGLPACTKIDELQKQGAQIICKKSDVNNFKTLSKVLSDVRESMPPLKGVFHLAGILGEGSILHQNLDHAKDIMAPKVKGAWNLHCATNEDSLDYFVMFSSISSLWGGHGLSAYAGANSFLDALAHYRTAIGLPGLSINWGAFSQVGMIAEDQKGAAFRQKFGLRSFTPLEALTHFIHVREFPQACICEMDWKRFFVHSDMKDEPFFSTLFNRYGALQIAQGKNTDFLTQLASLSHEKRCEMMGTYLTQKVSAALGMDASKISINDNLFHLGMDSLIFLSLAQTISDDLHITVVPHKLFENPNIEGLIKQFIGELQFEAHQEKDTEVKFMVENDPVNQNKPFPLTDIQHAYWLGRSGILELGDVGCHAYFEISTQNLGLDRYTAAWQRVIDRHEMLRAIILPDGHQQVLETVPPFEIQITDLMGESPGTIERQTALIRQEMSHQVRPADQWPLFEVRATILDDRHTLLHISMDILIADGYSIYNLMQEIDHYYRISDDDLAPIECTFRDYVLAESAFRESDTYQRSEQHWMGKLETLPPPPELPLAKSPSELEQTRFVRREARLDLRAWERLQSNASQSGLTRSNVLLSAYAEVLATWSKSREFTLNLTFFHRLQGHPRINEVIGDFTSLILLNVDVTHEIPFMERTRKIQEQLWKDMEFRHFSGVRVLQELSRKNQGGGRTLMPVVFTSNLGHEKIRPENTGLSLPGKLVYSISQTPQVWIDNQISEDKDGLVIVWDAVEELFPEDMLDHMFNAYHDLLKQLAQSYEAWHTNPELLPEVQIQRYREVNAAVRPISPETLNSLFIKQAEQQPDHTAVVTSSGRISYKDLHHKSMVIASLLAARGATANALVAVVMEKGWEQVAAVLGVLNAGAAYLPIDPTLPRERLWHLLKDGEVKSVLTQSWLDRTLEWPSDAEVCCVDTQDYTRNDLTSVQVKQTPDDLAYVIHTSGSTGLPKGVMIDHKGAVNTILDINNRYHLTRRDCVFALSNLNFDLSVYDIFGTLAAGATIVMPDDALRKDPGHWLSLIKAEHVTVWNSVPALMQMLVEFVSGRDEFHFDTLRLILLSGDWIPLDLPDKIRKRFDPANIISLGGATEASIWSILYSVNTVDPNWNSIPYGRPMVNQAFYVLNENMAPCPDWVPGQLFIGGTGLAKGYWRAREKTNASFIRNPRTGISLYRTGDMGRFLPDGNIEFLGREDQQVKINGYRIELGEIESRLKQIQGITEAVVVPVADQEKNRYLAGHIIADPEYGYKDKDLKQKLELVLPGYMVPGFYLFHDAFPVTANGKIDRKKLSDSTKKSLRKNTIDIVPPVNETEQTVSDIIKDVLCLEKVSTKSLFSDIGATSMHFVQMQNKLNEVFAKNVSVVNIFEYPTISSLSQFISETDNDSGAGDRTDKRVAIRKRLKKRNPGLITR
ncbi:MAG: amino acid adenylation domain-containing protein [Desulfatirhabdiaceae bacterium]